MSLIFTLTVAITSALILGFITQKLRLSPIVGYLIAGIIIGPHSPGIVADIEIANQFAEIGIILLMFGIGMHFHLSDLISVKEVAIAGALIQIIFTTVITAVVTKFLGWSWAGGLIFGISISVASTVVLTKVLSENRILYTPTGHTAVGWLVMEDLFTILVLVLVPIFFNPDLSASNVFSTLLITILKLAAFILLAFVVGKKMLPVILSFVAKTGNRELFSLSVLVLALGIAVAAAKFFGASMALGAFLAGMIVGQSDFSARATAEALPITDAFSVLFFVSVGMLFDVYSIQNSWKLMTITLTIILIAKPLIAAVVVILLKQPLKKAICIGIALGQIGEFSFILSTLGTKLNIMPAEANSAIIFASIISITLNTIIYRYIDKITLLVSKLSIFKKSYTLDDEIEQLTRETRHVIIVGYGPVGRTITNILLKAAINVIIIEMNIETVKEIKRKNITGLYAIHGDAARYEVLMCSGVETAESFIISSPVAPAKEIIEMVKSINSRIKILINTTYLESAKKFRRAGGASAVFSGEGSVALALSQHVLKDLGEQQIDSKMKQIYEELI